MTFEKKVKIATGIFSKPFPIVTTVFLAAEIVLAANVKIACTIERKTRRIEAVTEDINLAKPVITAVVNVLTKVTAFEKNFNMETGILSRPLMKEAKAFVTEDRTFEKKDIIEAGIARIAETTARNLTVSQEGPFLIVSFLAENFGIKMLSTSAD